MVDDSQGLLLSLFALRDCGPWAQPGIDAMLELDEVQQMTFALELVEGLLSMEGFNPTAVLLTRFDASTVEVMRRALRG